MILYVATVYIVIFKWLYVYKNHENGGGIFENKVLK